MTTTPNNPMPLYRYGAWANQETLTALQSKPDPPPRALVLMAHIIAAESLWIDRIVGVSSGIPVWPEWTLAECRAKLDEVKTRWETFLVSATPERLESIIPYTNTKGEAHTSVIADIVLHVLFHGSYHRGQIAAAVRASGQIPAHTDFIHATRLALLE